MVYFFFYGHIILLKKYLDQKLTKYNHNRTSFGLRKILWSQYYCNNLLSVNLSTIYLIYQKLTEFLRFYSGTRFGANSIRM